MKRKQYLLLVALTIISGLIGGAISNWLYVTQRAEAALTEAEKAFLTGETKKEKLIIAEEFWLVDENGKVFGRFAVSADKTPELVLLDADGNTRALFGLSGGLADLLDTEETRELFDKFDNTDSGEAARRLLREGYLGRPSLIFYDTSGEKRLNLQADSLHASLSLDTLGSSDTIVSDSLIRIGSVSLSSFGVMLSDENKKIRAKLVIDSDGRPSCRILDDSGTARAVLGCSDLKVISTGEGKVLAESSLVLFDKDSEVIWKAPPY